MPERFPLFQKLMGMSRRAPHEVYAELGWTSSRFANMRKRSTLKPSEWAMLRRAMRIPKRTFWATVQHYFDPGE